MFEQRNDEPEPAPRKDQIDIKQEAMEAVNRDKEIQQVMMISIPNYNQTFDSIYLMATLHNRCPCLRVTL